MSVQGGFVERLSVYVIRSPLSVRIYAAAITVIMETLLKKSLSLKIIK